MRSVILKDECDTMHVRVQPGFTVQVHDDHAPSVIQMVCEGQEIPNLAYEQAVKLIQFGAVRVVD